MDPFSWTYFSDNHLDAEEGDSDDNSSSIDKDEMNIKADEQSNSKKPKYNVTGDNDDIIDNLDMAKSYLHLAQAIGEEDGFDPTHPSVQLLFIDGTEQST